MVFVISMVSVIAAYPALNLLACDCPSCLRHSGQTPLKRPFVTRPFAVAPAVPII